MAGRIGNEMKRCVDRAKATLIRVARPLLLKLCPMAYARWVGVRMGDGCRWVCPRASTFGSEPYLVEIGDHVSIGAGTRFITHDGGVWVFRKDMPTLDVIAGIRVGNNVYLGDECLIMPGVRIEDNGVVGARSIVTRDVPANVVVVGAPAKVVSSLDDYRRRSEEKGMATKGMGREEKSSFLRGMDLKSGRNAEVGG